MATLQGREGRPTSHRGRYASPSLRPPAAPLRSSQPPAPADRAMHRRSLSTVQYRFGTARGYLLAEQGAAAKPASPQSWPSASAPKKQGHPSTKPPPHAPPQR